MSSQNGNLARFLGLALATFWQVTNRHLQTSVYPYEKFRIAAKAWRIKGNHSNFLKKPALSVADESFMTDWHPPTVAFLCSNTVIASSHFHVWLDNTQGSASEQSLISSIQFSQCFPLNWDPKFHDLRRVNVRNSSDSSVSRMKALKVHPENIFTYFLNGLSHH